ncbi:MAG TPA: hypothetical protein VEQ17_03610, partial [Steroidobacteraceae bacterium]|nr:hypothetical protein [Steroidobacteraceae bacterium]
MMAAWLSGGSIALLDRPLLVVMKFNTALSLLLCAIGLLAASREPPARAIVWIAGGALFGMALLNLSQYAFHLNLGIDQLFVTDPSPVRFPGRSSPVVATGLAAIGLGLLLVAGSRISASQVV